jgi:hypothetical protein
MKIGGNTELILQVKQDDATNKIGEPIENWIPVKTLVGWLDLMGDGISYKTFNTKVQESTHVFVCDYEPLLYEGEEIGPECARAVINNKKYEIKLIDNPMNMNYSLEIYLNFIGGGQNVSEV